MKSVLLTTAVLIFLTACAPQTPTHTAQPPSQSNEQTVQTMVTGIDQFDGGAVWGLNTSHGTFVVGPEVSGEMKNTVYEHLMKAHDRVITIRYRATPANGEMLAHKRVTALLIQDTPYIFTR